jgi:hypothetical protein
MNCERIREQIPECLAGRLDKAARERLVEHLETCAGCRAEVAEMNAVWRGLEALKAPEPDPAMRTRFTEVLEAYQAGMGVGSHGLSKARSWFPAQPAWQISLVAALVILGVFFGRSTAPQPPAANPEVAQLKGQVENLRQIVTLSLLQEQSPSARLRGVTYSEQLAQPDEQVEQALLHAVNHDSNVNVRLSAVDALAKYSRRPEMVRGLVDAIPVQDSPLVQVALIDMLVQLNARGAAPALGKLAKDAEANEEVRQRAALAAQKLEVSR